MPIGWLNGDGRIVNHRSESARKRTRPQTSWWNQLTATARQTAQIVSRDEPVHRELIPTIWTRWTTAFDDRVCPICSPYAGRVWPDGVGPEPPLHPNCRCTRRYAFTTWKTS